MGDLALKPCPFCGSGIPVLRSMILYPHPFAKSGHVVVCQNCGAAMTDYDENHCMRDVIHSWNRREGPVNTVNLLDALEKRRSGISIAADMHWTLHDYDFLILGALYQSGRFRFQIEEILEESDFHPELRALKSGDMDEYFKLSLED